MAQLGATGALSGARQARENERRTPFFAWRSSPSQADKRSKAVPRSFLDERLRPSSQRTYRRRFSRVRWQSLSSRARVQLFRRFRRLSGSLWSSLSQAKLAVRLGPKRCKLKAVVRTSVSSPLLADGRIAARYSGRLARVSFRSTTPRVNERLAKARLSRASLRARKLGPKCGAGSRSPTVNGAVLRASRRDPKSAPE